MRRALFVTFAAILGCAKPTPPAVALPPTPDPIAARREDDAQAAFEFDAACASVEETRNAAKKLAPIAGGDAKEALLEVAEKLDSAGATLADHAEDPPPLETYRKEEPTEERRLAVTDALDALKDLREARDVLADLAENVPPEHTKPLTEIQAGADEAIDAVETGIQRLGGKNPARRPTLGA